ncbi:MAG: preprotein translocase subunit SecY [Candidatus Verstraetearchaeota archaeon]|jgi:preprotein translocase SecY subunit|nr:preprotein translocase subunit SecY [Candidatus Verstraetearchaeota archaeon]
MVRFLDLMEPILRFIPEIPRPQRKLDLKYRLLWTGLVLAIYLVMCEIPLYGISIRTGEYEQFLIYRIIFASKKGSLMDLGIGPIVTAGLIMQIIAGSKLINIDLTKPRDRALFTGTQKFLAIIITIFEATVFLIGGSYGRLDLLHSILVIIQLTIVGILVILLDELIQKGWGIGSGVSLFILAGVSQQILWLSFSPIGPVADGKSLGAVIAFFQTMINGENILKAFSRYPYPDMTGFITMIIILLVAIYLEGMRIEIPVAHPKYGGLRARIPLKFMYVSNIPIILTSALFANFYLFGQLIWQNFNFLNNNPLINWFVMFNSTATGLQPLPGCFIYYITSPRSLAHVIHDPLHAVIYVIMLVFFSTIFAKIWVEVSGMSAQAQAQQLIAAGLQIPGFRRSPIVIEHLLSKYIPPLTIMSGIMIGLLAGIADMLGAIGTGIGILLSVGIVYQYYQLLAREHLEEIYPGISKILGRE